MKTLIICIILSLLPGVLTAQSPPTVDEKTVDPRQERLVHETLRLLPRHAYAIPENIIVLGLMVRNSEGIDKTLLGKEISRALVYRGRFQVHSESLMKKTLSQQNLSLEEMTSANEKDFGRILGLDAFLKVWAQKDGDELNISLKCISIDKCALVWTKNLSSRDKTPLRLGLGLGMGRQQIHAIVQPAKVQGPTYTLNGESRSIKENNYPFLLNLRLLGRITQTRLFDIGGDMAAGWDPDLTTSGTEGTNGDQLRYVVESGYHAHLSLLLFLRLHLNEIIGSQRDIAAIYAGYGLSLASGSELVYIEELPGGGSRETSCLIPSQLRPLLRFGCEVPLGSDYSLFTFWEKAYQQGHGLNTFKESYYLEGAQLEHRVGVVIMKYFNMGE